MSLVPLEDCIMIIKYTAVTKDSHKLEKAAAQKGGWGQVHCRAGGSWESSWSCAESSSYSSPESGHTSPGS